MSKGDNESNDNADYYKKWEAKEMVDEKIKLALIDYDKVLWEKIKDKLKIELAHIRTWVSVNKFVAVAVALLFIGTLYQLFVSVANSVGLK